jgi:hypothetical protein
MSSLFSLFFVEFIDGLGGSLDGLLSLLALSRHHGTRHIAEETNSVSISLCFSTSSKGTSEHISVLLIWEVDIIVSVRVWVLNWVVSVILPCRVGSQVLGSTVTPVLDIEISHGSSFIVVTNCHCSLIGLVIDCFSSEVPLSLLSKSFENMLWADLHD